MKIALAAALLGALDAPATVSAAGSCACAAEDLGFAIDCAAEGVMLDSLTYLQTNNCAADCSTESCVKHYYVVQAHHDYCPEADIPQKIEDGFHDYDESCEGCKIQRNFIPGAPDCPEPNCEDDSGNAAYTTLLETGCATDCSSEACRDNFFTLRSVHDLCDHETLTTASEKGLHDLEEPCAAQLCNHVGDGVDQLVCDDHSGHDHGGAAYEWAGSFALADAKHVWSMQKVGGDYADPAMKVVLIATDSPGEETQESFEEMAEALIEGECVLVEDGGTMTAPTAEGTCFQLMVNDDAMDSMFNMDTTGITGVAVFAEHFPTEFERDQHYLKDSAGVDIEPVHTEGGDGHDGHDHGGHDEDAVSCACAAEDLGFEIDCAAEGVMLDSLSFLQTNACATDCSSESCKMHYYVVQAHHDFCPEADIPEKIEDGFHDYDATCKGCKIQRNFIPGAPDCPEPNCEDDSGNMAYTALLDTGCKDDCSSDACRDNFFVLRSTHDLCDHETLTMASEIGLHDLEGPCATQLCNHVEGGVDQLKCDDHSGHDHGGGPYEWAGSFALADEKHVWSMQKVGGEYADPSMKVVLIATDSPGEEHQESVEDAAAALIEGECVVVEDGGMMTVSTDGKCFQLKVNDGAMDSTFNIDTSGIKGFAVFAEHFPTEFERDQHYLKDSAGADIEPVHTEGGDGHDGHDHGDDHGSEAKENMDNDGEDDAKDDAKEDVKDDAKEEEEVQEGDEVKEPDDGSGAGAAVLAGTVAALLGAAMVVA